MRRKECEVRDLSEIKEIIEHCQVLHLGFNDHDEVYIVPVNFGYEFLGETLNFYFHGAKAGRKFELISKQPKIGFELDGKVSLITGEKACDYSCEYVSVIGNGQVFELKEINEKIHGLNLLMKKASGKSNWEYSEAMLKAVGVFKLSVNNYSAKKHLR